MRTPKRARSGKLVRLTDFECRELAFMWRDTALKLYQLAKLGDQAAMDYVEREAERAEQRAKFLGDQAQRPPTQMYEND